MRGLIIYCRSFTITIVNLRRYHIVSVLNLDAVDIISLPVALVRLLGVLRSSVSLLPLPENTVETGYKATAYKVKSDIKLIKCLFRVNCGRL